MADLGKTTVSIRTLRQWQRRADTILRRAEELRRDTMDEADDFSDRADNIATEAEDMIDLLDREIGARLRARDATKGDRE